MLNSGSKRLKGKLSQYDDKRTTDDKMDEEEKV